MYFVEFISTNITRIGTIPVDLEGLSGNVPAEVRLVPDDPAMEDLHTAAIWIQVAEADDTE